MVMSFQFHRRPSAADENQIAALTWADLWLPGWTLTWVKTCIETWAEGHTEMKGYRFER
jgi:hypothetical protein